MFIPEHLIIEEEQRREEQTHDRRIPLYAPQRMPQFERPRNEENDKDEPASRGPIVIDMNTYEEVE